jgi:hypothetical protein
VFGDLEIIVGYVINTINYLSPHLRGYQQEVWNLLYSFEAFNIESICHCQNVATNILENTTSKYTPINDGFYVEITFRPSIPDKFTIWRVLNNDTQIINFLTISDVFQAYVIDDESQLRSSKISG